MFMRDEVIFQRITTLIKEVYGVTGIDKSTTLNSFNAVIFLIIVSGLQASLDYAIRYPGRCPGLRCFSPLGLMPSASAGLDVLEACLKCCELPCYVLLPELIQDASPIGDETTEPMATPWVCDIKW